MLYIYIVTNNINMNLSDLELTVIHRGLVRVDISAPGLRSVMDKIKQEFKDRGIEVDYLPLPKAFKGQRKKEYDYRYTISATKEIIK